jgi:hypothetical protein
MACDDMALGISQNRIGEAECFDRLFELLDLPLRMGSGVARVGNEVANCAIGDGQPRRDCNRGFIVHDGVLFCR